MQPMNAIHLAMFLPDATASDLGNITSVRFASVNSLYRNNALLSAFVARVT